MVVYIPIYQEASDDASNIEKRLTVANTDPSVILSADHQILYSVVAVRRKVIDLTDPQVPVVRSLRARRGRRSAVLRSQGRRSDRPSRCAALAPRRGRRWLHDLDAARQEPGQRATTGASSASSRTSRPPQQIESLKSKDEILNLYANSSLLRRARLRHRARGGDLLRQGPPTSSRWARRRCWPGASASPGGSTPSRA